MTQFCGAVRASQWNSLVVLSGLLSGFLWCCQDFSAGFSGVVRASQRDIRASPPATIVEFAQRVYFGYTYFPKSYVSCTGALSFFCVDPHKYPDTF
ncbi:hypothetical protein Btru_041547 [Bulinus truncatus]|nr:hypothetical protein Btru_041547 [Bulinus truncatus]